MDEFRKYITDNGYSVPAAAHALGYSRQWLNLVLSGKKRPGRKLAEKVERYTNGKIKAAAFMGMQ